MADPYRIQYARQAEHDLLGLRAFDARAVLSAVEQHLQHAPARESRSRIKRMRQPY